jgi:hypothetical protein
MAYWAVRILFYREVGVVQFLQTIAAPVNAALGLKGLFIPYLCDIHV